MKILFSERIRSLRIENNLTQQELATALNTTQRKISHWESGKIEPDLESLWNLANIFSVTIDYLIGKTDY